MEQFKLRRNFFTPDCTFILVLCCVQFLNVHSSETSSKLADLYKTCRNTSKPSRVCYGYSALGDTNCLESQDCDYLVVSEASSVPVDVITSNVPPYANKETELTIKSYILGNKSTESYDFWLTNDKSSFLYRCSRKDSDHHLGESSPSFIGWRSFKKVYSQMTLKNESIMGCTWLVSPGNLNWPANDLGKPVDLINDPYWCVFEFHDGTDKDEQVKYRSLPIHKMNYLYEGCNEQTKICHGVNDCVQSNSCSELLIITNREYDKIYIDFMLLVLAQQEKAYYIIDIKPSTRMLNNDQSVIKKNETNETSFSNDHLQLRAQCDLKSCHHKVIFPDSREIKMDESLLAYSSNQMIGPFRQFIWSLPMIFSVNGTSFNSRNTMYQVLLTSSNGLIHLNSMSPGLPGYSLREDIFKECKAIDRINKEPERFTVCYGFDKNNLDSKCLECSTCSVVAILKPMLTLITGGHGVEREALELQLYGPARTSSIGLFFKYNEDPSASFGYQCITAKRNEHEIDLKNKEIVSNEISGQMINERANEAHGSMFCRFIISEDQGSWPLMKNGAQIDLIRNPIPITLTWNHYQQIVDPKGSLNPVYRFRYVYESCLQDKVNILCLGFDNCIAHRNCTNLVVISFSQKSSTRFPPSSNGSLIQPISSPLPLGPFHAKRRGGADEHQGTLNWAVYAADESDSFVVSFSGDNLYGDDYAIMCTPSGFSEHYIWETGKLKPIKETIIRDTKRLEKVNSPGFRCFWTMPSLFSVFFHNYRFDAFTDTVYLNLTFLKDKNRQHVMRLFTTLPGYKSKSSGTTWMRLQQLPFIIKIESGFLIIHYYLIYYYYF